MIGQKGRIRHFQITPGVLQPYAEDFEGAEIEKDLNKEPFALAEVY